MKMFEVGFDRRQITPPVGTKLFGYPNNRKSESVHDDLHVNAIALRYGEMTAMLINLEICSLPYSLSDDIRKKVEEKTGISAAHCIIACTHTHSGPSTKTSHGWGDADDAFTMHILLPRAIEAAAGAFQNLQKAEMGIGLTESFAGVNRRQIEDGKAILGQNPSAPFDPKMYLLAFRTPAGEPIVNIVHYGAHPTSCGPGPEITRDWPGIMIDTVEAETGIPTVFFNGAEGDIGPRLSNGLTIGDISYVEEIGKAAGKDAMRAWNAVKTYASPVLQMVTDDITLPYDPFPTKEEAEKALIDLGTPVNGVDFMLESRMQRIIKHYADGKPIEECWIFKQTILRLGDIVFVPYPFEVFCQIAINQQKKSPFPHTLCLACANGTECYLPTEDQIPFGGYEIDAFKRQQIFVLTDDAGERIVLENQRLLEKLQ